MAVLSNILTARGLATEGSLGKRSHCCDTSDTFHLFWHVSRSPELSNQDSILSWSLMSCGRQNFGTKVGQLITRRKRINFQKY